MRALCPALVCPALVCPALVCAALVLGPAEAEGQEIRMRPIDRATVRVIGVSGLGTSTGAGRTTRVRRVGVEPVVGHGSGVAIGPRTVLTARHVVWGMSAYAVVPPGSSEPIAARVTYVDLAHDIAFIELERDLAHHVRLPGVRTLTMSESISVSGYPLDLREPNPAASGGEVSRITRDGLLHLNLTANPGNSGGPVVDGAGRVIGIVSMRGRPEAGIEGLVIAVPLPMILEARAQIPDTPVRFAPHEVDVAQAVALIAALNEERLNEARDQVLLLIGRATTTAALRPEHSLIFAGLAWNTALSVMETHGAPTRAAVPEASRALVTTLHAFAVSRARAALEAEPYVRREFSAARLMAIGRLAPFGTEAR